MAKYEYDNVREASHDDYYHSNDIEFVHVGDRGLPPDRVAMIMKAVPEEGEIQMIIEFPTVEDINRLIAAIEDCRDAMYGTQKHSSN